jgi:hypothetical protein
MRKGNVLPEKAEVYRRFRKGGLMFYKMPLWRQIKKTKALLFMLIPGLIYYLVFHYGPIYGLVIAF